jgi:hypothetical protein
MMNEAHLSGRHLRISVIPVLVTGIQCATSVARETSFPTHGSFHRADARWLDPCDKHRDDGGVGFVLLASNLTAKERTQ